MGINKTFKLLVVFVFIISFFSCKGDTKNNKDVIVDDTSIIYVEKKNNILLDNVQANLKPKDLILEFYTKYIKYLEDPLNEKSLDYGVYLTEDLINEIGKNWGYDYIIQAQDSTIEWLKTLKVEDTEKNNVYSVSRERGYYDSDDNTIYVTVIELEKGKLKISKISRALNDQPVSSSAENEEQDDKFTYYAFNYKVNAGDSMEEISYLIEYLEEDYIVFIKRSYYEHFEYKFRQEGTKEEVSFYYKETVEGEEYTGDSSKPLIRIYKKGNDFYAVSSLIEDGKEVKLVEVESKY